MELQAFYREQASEVVSNAGDRLSYPGKHRVLHSFALENVKRMTQVVLGENEGIDSALRRFKRQVSKAGILADLRSHRHIETPLEKRKRKAIVARRKRRYSN
jgi:small subunit ribosomal protein S21